MICRCSVTRYVPLCVRVCSADYWALAEMIAAAGLLGARTGEACIWRWYDAAWEFALSHFIDKERGGWYPMVSRENVRRDTHAGDDHVGLPVKC